MTAGFLVWPMKISHISYLKMEKQSSEMRMMKAPKLTWYLSFISCCVLGDSVVNFRKLPSLGLFGSFCPFAVASFCVSLLLRFTHSSLFFNRPPYWSLQKQEENHITPNQNLPVFLYFPQNELAPSTSPVSISAMLIHLHIPHTSFAGALL